MKERPILFSAPMVRAILAGTKAQTRRLVKWPIYSNGTRYDRELGDILCHNDYLPPSAMLMEVTRGKTSYVTSNLEAWEHECPYGEPGDRLWVRETWRTGTAVDGANGVTFAADGAMRTIEDTVRAADLWVADHDNGRHGDKWRPSIFMRRWASRITLEVTDVRVERLRDVSESDALAEGVDPYECPSGPAGPCAKSAFAELWDKINADRAPWASNPWVWAVSFKQVQP